MVLLVVRAGSIRIAQARRGQKPLLDRKPLQRTLPGVQFALFAELQVESRQFGYAKTQREDAVSCFWKINTVFLKRRRGSTDLGRTRWIADVG